jgi:hypothetical protein
MPTKLPQEVEEKIEHILQSSRLVHDELEELRRELESHFVESIYDRELDGSTVREAVTEFGDSQQIGKQLYFANRKYERLPLIGELLYYPPFLLTVLMIFSTIGLAILATLTLDNVNMSSHSTIVIPAATIGFLALLQGGWLKFHTHTSRDLLATLALTYTSLAILVIFLELNFRQGYTISDADFLVVAMLGLLLHLGLILSGMTMTTLIQLITKRYEK